MTAKVKFIVCFLVGQLTCFNSAFVDLTYSENAFNIVCF